MMRAMALRAIGAPLIVEERPKPRARAPSHTRDRDRIKERQSIAPV